MNETQNGQPDKAELLLPWYATGKLSAQDRQEVESALAADAELVRRLALVRDEAAETIALNENLRSAPAGAMDKLMAKIDLHEARHPRRMLFIAKAFGRIGDALAALSPRTLAWSATAAALVICLQAGLVTSQWIGKQEEATYKTASAETTSETNGTYALVSFVDTISLQDLSDFLTTHHAMLQEGPKPGGLYRVKIADQKLTGEALNAKLAEFRAETKVVGFILPEGAKP
ncbi:MAG: hypothetical protein ACLPID_09825 [Beijerinckiaceae bacterium]